MAEQWIDAAAALGIISSEPGSHGEHLAALALCRRAHGGLIAAKAKLFVVGDRREEGAEIPAAFWWAEGEAALDQNWTTGDFSTWINDKIECRAFGVTFSVSGVLDMLPAGQRSAVARRLSVAGNSEWVRAGEAAGLACQLPGVRDGRAFVVEQARLGLMPGRAVLAQGFPARHIKTWVWEEREWTAPMMFWDAVSDFSNSLQDWNLGQFSARFSIDGETQWLQASGVHFSAEPLRSPSAEPPAPVPEASGKPNVGGRPAQAWWDDLWCDVWGLIYEGKLIPKTQAEVEKAMLEWAAQHGHSPAESTIRLKARKLFKVFSDGVENPPRP